MALNSDGYGDYCDDFDDVTSLVIGMVLNMTSAVTCDKCGVNGDDQWGNRYGEKYGSEYSEYDDKCGDK